MVLSAEPHTIDSSQKRGRQRLSEKMIVACPECRTRFVAPLEKFLPNGRKVRCAKCGHSWFQQPDAAAVAQSVSPSASPSGETDKSESLDDRAAQATTSESVIERAEARRAEQAARQAPGDLGAIASSVSEDAQSGLESAAASDTASQSVAPVETYSNLASGGTASIAAGAAATATAAAITANSASAQSDMSNAVGSAADLDETSYGAGSTADTDRYDAPEPKRRSWLRMLFYALALAIIAAVLGYFFKDAISARVPALAPYLQTLHDKVDGAVTSAVPTTRQMRIENVKYDFEEIDGGRALLVSAEVVNDGTQSVPAPELAVRIYDSANTVLHESKIYAKDLQSEIDVQDRAEYAMRLPLPPENMDRVEVDFSAN